MQIYLIREHSHNINDITSSANFIRGIYASEQLAQSAFDIIRRRRLATTNIHSAHRKISEGRSAFSMWFDFGFCVDVWIEEHQLIEEKEIPNNAN